MDILKRNLSPLSDAAWTEVDELFQTALTANISARRVVDVRGPHGWDYAAVPLGRLTIPEGQIDEGICFGIHRVQPLVEIRMPFTLGIWELDDIDRGCRDPHLEPVVAAAKALAAFEDMAVYGGFKAGSITGLAEAAAGRYALDNLKDEEVLLWTLSRAKRDFAAKGINGPFVLVAGRTLTELLDTSMKGPIPLRKRVENLVESEIVYSPHFDGICLLSQRGGDGELTVGQDFSIGYSHHDGQKVHLFAAASFTFRLLTPEAVAVIDFTRTEKSE